MSEARLFHLAGRGTSVVLEAVPDGPPRWRHWGVAVDPSGLAALADQRSAASYSMDADVPLTSAPTGGNGWFGPVLLACHRDGADAVPVWDQCRTEADAGGLKVTLSDSTRGVRLVQQLRIDNASDCLTLSASVTNIGGAPLTVAALVSAILPLPASAAGITSFQGRHNAELQRADEAMPAQIWRRTSRRGLTGHGGPPGLFVRDGLSGGVWAVQLAWSGDSDLAVVADDEGGFILSAGAALAPGELVLAPGDSWTAPDLIATFSPRGMNGASANFHAAIRSRMIWPGGAMRPRPVHFNSWEACYFAHDEDVMLGLIERAAALGCERFVLDDGWFKGRSDDRAGLGDWTVDAGKYPAGLGRLAQRITDLGMEFGLWVEPEMVNPDSDLFRVHPDWALAVAGAAPPTSRNQLVLDMARAEVRDHLFAALDALLTDLPIAYLKWDHNRDLSPNPRPIAQVEGSYALLARLRRAHPAVEIESCAGGGGRIDAGVAAHTHRFWTSDNIDALSRVAIQRGFLAFMPPELMGSHVGASPAHATGRTQRLDFRASVAVTGHLGVELDPAKLSDADRAGLADWIGFYKHWRGLLHGGQLWLGDGGDGLVWQAQGAHDRFLLFVHQLTPPQRRRPQPLALPFVDDAARRVTLLRATGLGGAYRFPLPPLFAAMQDGPQRFAGSWLRGAGLPLPMLRAEGAAVFLIETGAPPPY
jgi:alpha-galactosidase